MMIMARALIFTLSILSFNLLSCAVPQEKILQQQSGIILDRCKNKKIKKFEEFDSLRFEITIDSNCQKMFQDMLDHVSQVNCGTFFSTQRECAYRHNRNWVSVHNESTDKNILTVRIWS
jgi:hypothetical protein